MDTKTPEILVGEDVRQIAARKARYGHRTWISWKGRDGQQYAARCTPETVKQAMLATGTQNKFMLYAPNGAAGMLVWWGLAAMWLRNAKAGLTHYYFD